ncbi:MAG: type II toxin-antitoxin system RelE/ParE family toxin [Clostridia bacterium]|nr:type II toxin-antitoxin system RelE/ParE family toxin [Clostridia bacterium]MBQ8513589.1 type II toxin-antitoxin system RelE/ParE family toxin [Clostridia bacterium]
MIFKIRISERAENDIRAIYRYIAYDIGAPEAAARLIGRIETGIRSLDEMPERYRAYHRESLRKRGLRVMPVENYLIFYIPDKETQTVSIVRVIYKGRDVEKQLTEE